jgi:hypothetical protein
MCAHLGLQGLELLQVRVQICGQSVAFLAAHVEQALHRQFKSRLDNVPIRHRIGLAFNRVEHPRLREHPGHTDLLGGTCQALGYIVGRLQIALCQMRIRHDVIPAFGGLSSHEDLHPTTGDRLFNLRLQPRLDDRIRPGKPHLDVSMAVIHSFEFDNNGHSPVGRLTSSIASHRMHLAY